MKVTVVTVSAPAVQQLIRAAQRLGPKAELRLYYAVEEFPAVKQARMEEDIASADCVLVDLMGSPPTVIQAVERGLARCSGQILPYGASCREYLLLGGFSAASMKRRAGEAPSMEAMKRMQDMAEGMEGRMPGPMRDMRNYTLLMKYFQYAD